MPKNALIFIKKLKNVRALPDLLTSGGLEPCPHTTSASCLFFFIF